MDNPAPRNGWADKTAKFQAIRPKDRGVEQTASFQPIKTAPEETAILPAIKADSRPGDETAVMPTVNRPGDETTVMPTVNIRPGDQTVVLPTIQSDGRTQHFERVKPPRKEKTWKFLPALQPEKETQTIVPDGATREVRIPRSLLGLAPVGGGTQVLVRPRARIDWMSREVLVVLALVLVAFVAQGLNMFNYPSFTFKDDEGIYASQAWAVLREGRLTPYTYFYDHAPLGWILLAGWMFVTGGVHTFGLAIDSGRVLMLLLHLASVPLFFKVARRLGSNLPLAAIATFLFSASPLAVFYQRMVLLDNIMIFWVLLSLYLLLDGWGRLSRLIWSGVCFGVAVLTKETAIFLLPALLFIAWNQRWKHQGKFGLVGWTITALVVISFYPLYALLKGELLSAGQTTSALFGGNGGISLLDSLKWQASRGTETFNFFDLVRQQWLTRDAVLFLGGTLASLINLVRGLRDKRAMAAGLLGLLPLVYLARGGIVFDYYVIFAIPFLALNIAVLLSGLPLRPRLSTRARGVLTIAMVLALLVGYWLAGTLQPLYAARPDEAGREALAWIKQNIPADSTMIIRDDMWTDLHEPGLGGPAFPNAHSHWKVAQDPAVRTGIFKDDWKQVDYLVMSEGLKEAFQQTNNTIALEALNHAHLVKRWTSEKGNETLHPQQIIEVWKVDKPGETESALLTGSENFLARHFEKDGAYAEANGKVTSEHQANALMRAVWMNDRETFDRVWNWTKANLLNQKGLLSWQWNGGKVTEARTASDADTDTALALLMASKQWNDPALGEAGRQMVNAIWLAEVTTVKGKPYLVAGDWASSPEQIALNPGYFAPYAYRIFKEVDPQHNWQGVIDSSYDVLFNASKAPLGASRSAGLPPDWVGMNVNTGELFPLKVDNTDTTRYGYEAARTYWRIALDLNWSNDGRASTYLKQAGFLRDEVNQVLQDGVTQKGRVSAVYNHDGSVVEETPSLVGTAGALAALLTLDPGAANTLYAGQVVGLVNHTIEGAYWGFPSDLYTQEWGWYATALYNNSLPDLWHAH